MIWIHLLLGLIFLFMLAVIVWLKRICYVMIEVWRVAFAGRYPDSKTGEQIDMAVSYRLELMLSKDMAKRWLTLTRGEK